TGTTNFSGGTSNLTLTNLTYQTVQRDPYYQTATSPLLDAGSTCATNSGLYHFTSTTNQIKELCSIVNIGLHYISLSNGVPVDSDGDSLPDYVENVSGTGLFGSGETDWQNPDTDYDGRSDAQ